MNRIRLLALVAGTTLAAGALTACGSSDASEDASATEKEVVVYTADGLNDGDDSYFQQVARAFKAETGISVKYVEAGSGEVLQRVVQEQGNPQADLLVTLPPFIQNAAEEGLLAESSPEGTDQVPADKKSPDGTYYTLVDNYYAMIHHTDRLPTPPKTLEDLLDGSLKGKLQYSTPGVAGDGTAFMILVRELLGDDAEQYFADLQENNVGPSDSTGQLAAKVNKGELLVANGDVQMNYAQSASMPNLGIFFPAGPDGKPTTVSLPSVVGLVKDAPHKANAEKFLDFLFSEKVQAMNTTAGGGFPAREDIEPEGEVAQDLAEIMEGVTVLHPDWTEIAADMDEIIAEYNAATGTL